MAATDDRIILFQQRNQSDIRLALQAISPPRNKGAKDRKEIKFRIHATIAAFSSLCATWPLCIFAVKLLV